MDHFSDAVLIRIYKALLLSTFCGLILSCQSVRYTTEGEVWPEVEREMKPWTRWWWMGSAVDEQNLERLLDELATKGFGGVEIAPIYGVQGTEDRYIDYLSPRWVQLMRYTVTKADSLGMGVDMTTGTGWPFGGPTITSEVAASKLTFQKYLIKKGVPVDGPIRIDGLEDGDLDAEIIAVTAYGPDNEVKDLIDRVNAENELDWTPDEGRWTVYVALNGRTGQKVKRAAPGGEGYTFDHLSQKATHHYLERFDEAFGESFPGIRNFFNDSYEVYGASWSDDFMDEFEARRGYSITQYIRELSGDGDRETVARVKSDYRRTMSDVLIDNFSSTWTAWANQRGIGTRNQAHGSPANLLDVYTSVDTPEIETFGATHFEFPGFFWDSDFVKEADHNPLFLKLAASAANLSGKPLVSSEMFTWLGEHFRVPLSQTKPEAEQAWLAGVNHIFFHGTPYSPSDATWPGWLFYASVNFSSTNSFWPHIQGLNNYITRSQSILQTTISDNDVLVYWPIHDAWHDAQGMEMMMAVHGSKQWLAFPQVEHLRQRGYSFDFVSDAQLKTLTARNSELVTADEEHRYKAVLVPDADYMPLSTLQRLKAFSDDGVPVILEGLPDDVPGLSNLKQRRQEMTDTLASASEQFRVNPDFDQALEQVGVYRETLVDTGLQFLRKQSSRGTYYFLVNHSPDRVDQLIDVNSVGGGVLLLDSQSGAFGKIPVDSNERRTRFRVQVDPGESLFALVTTDPLPGVRDWLYTETVGDPVVVDGVWSLEFIEGGPELPDDHVMQTLTPWTELGLEAMDRFSGTARYSVEFEFTETFGDGYILDLGTVYHSARVELNGHDLGVLWSAPYEVKIGPYLKTGENTLVIEVANLMANRVRDMDRRDIEWRKFHDINFVDINYGPFDSSGWGVMPSGLKGPITIQPVSSVSR